VFARAIKLQSAKFEGNAPTGIVNAFSGNDPNFKVYYPCGATGYNSIPSKQAYCQVIYNTKGGSSVPNDTFDVGSSISSAPTNPTRAGYTFQGWSATDGGSVVEFPYSPGVATDITLYAKWASASHSVTFNSKGGTSVSSGSFNEGGSIGSSSSLYGSADPANYVATFAIELGARLSTSQAGWVKTVKYFKYAGDNSSHSAHIWSSDGTLLASQDFVDQSSSGWQSVVLDAPVFIEANQTFTISVYSDSFKWGDRYRTEYDLGPLTFIGSKFAFGGAPSYPSGDYGSVFSVDLVFETSSATAPTRSGYSFQGWSATDGGSVVSFPYSPGVTTTVTLYALWSADSHAVTFNSKGGTNVSAGSFDTDGSLTQPTAPTRTGYTFLGWSATDGGSVVEFPYSPSATSDITLYAKWSADSHVVTFNSKCGTNVSAGLFATDGSLGEPTAPTRTGYTFLGWSATDGGSAVEFPYSPGVIVDVTLYAKWSINTYLVSFNPKGGTSVTSGSFVYDGSIASAPRVPYRSGATFAGWSATDGGSAVSFPYSPGVASNVTLYAKWIVLAPVLSTSTPTTLVPGDVVTLRVSRVNEGCTVSVGWTGANSGVSSVSKIIKADRTTGVFTIATPAIAGSYTLSTNRISAECSGGLAVTLAKAFVIGKSSSVMAKVVTSNVYVAKNPVVSVSGTVKSGSVAVSNKAVTVSLRRNGVEVATASGTTNGSGVFNISLSSGSYVSGDYTAVVTVVADSVYRQAQVTTTKLTLR
jgi:uncharacterized repeat protein (TIGR02543 family)